MQHPLAPAPHPVHVVSQANAVEHGSWFPRSSDHPISSPQAELQAELREQLLGPVQQPGAQAHAAGLNLGPATAADQNIDPAIAGTILPVGGSVHVNGAQSEEPLLRAEAKRSSKRELSSSKRAAQNRAAQRAFRQRKEGYIKKLEEQVKNTHATEEALKALQAENYQLRDYIISLQSRLIEAQGDFPQPPSNIDLGQPRHDALPPPPPPPPQQPQPVVPGAGAAVAVPTAQMGGGAGGGAGGGGAGAGGATAAAPSPSQGDAHAHAHSHAARHQHDHLPLQVSAAQVVAAATAAAAAAAVDVKPLHGQAHDEAAPHSSLQHRLRVAEVQRLKVGYDVPRVDPTISALRAGG